MVDSSPIRDDKNKKEASSSAAGGEQLSLPGFEPQEISGADRQREAPKGIAEQLRKIASMIRDLTPEQQAALEETLDFVTKSEDVSRRFALSRARLQRAADKHQFYRFGRSTAVSPKLDYSLYSLEGSSQERLFENLGNFLKSMAFGMGYIADFSGSFTPVVCQSDDPRDERDELEGDMEIVGRDLRNVVVKFKKELAAGR